MITSLKKLRLLNEYSVSERHTAVRALALTEILQPLPEKKSRKYLLSWPPFSRKATHRLTTRNGYIL